MGFPKIARRQARLDLYLRISTICYNKSISLGGRRAPTSTWCPLGTLRETVQRSLSAERSSKTRLSFINDASTRRKSASEPHETQNITATVRERRLRPFHVRPRRTTDLGTPFSCPTTVLRNWRLRSTRRRGRIEEKDAVKTAKHTNTKQQRTHLRESDHPLSATCRRVENQPPNLTKHHTSQPQYARGSCAPFGYAHD
jgi:hypothetical protein